MLVAGVAAGVVAWAGSASAGPAVITAARVEALSAPSREASVVSELGQGAPVCVLDRSNYPGVVLDRAGWLAIRLPGGVGYVPVETVDLAAPAPEVANCGGSGESTAAPAVQAPAPVLQPGAAPIAAFPRQSGAAPIAAFPRTSASEPAPAVDRPALLPGRFLPLRPARLLLGIGSGMQWLDSPTAAANKIGDSGVTFNGTLGFTLYDIVMVSTTGSFVHLTDGAAFSEDVVNEMGGGDPHSAGSGLVVGSYSIAVGLRTPFWAIGAVENGWAAGSLFVQYGAAGVSGARAISDCVDCRVDEITLSGGAFWRLGVDLFLPLRKPPAGYGLTVSYDHYDPGAGLRDELRIGFSYWR
jgi:hypothetical protein